MSESRPTRGSRADLRLVNSSIHPGQPCQPCSLCKRSNLSKYFHPKSWKDNSLLKRLQDFEPALNIKPDSCICRSCRQDVSFIGRDNFIPRWKKIDIVNCDRDKGGQCFVTECLEYNCKRTTLADKAKICSVFGMDYQIISSSDDCDGISLCTYHYGILYRTINPSHINCKTCNKHITDITKSRIATESDVIEALRSERNTCSESTCISSSDRLCFTCYKSYLIVQKRLNGLVQSTDSHLQELVNTIENNTPALSTINTSEKFLLYASSLSAIYVGKVLLKQTALLLPEVYATFKTNLSNLASERNISIEYPTSIWLRSKLSTMLEHHMAYKCSVQKIGTVLYRYGGDLIHALSFALTLGKNHLKNDTLSNVCLALNEKCHKTIKELIKEDSQHPHNIESINIDECIDKLDPDIWKAISLLTEPLSRKDTTNTIQVRKIRRFFCVCLLFFTINNQCSFPLHTLLSEVIETCGGSIHLVRMLNRLGVCASPETALRYSQYRIQKRAREGIMAPYPSKCFMIASLDNIDYVHHYARVYSGNQQLSWHGTTVQIAQPKPITLPINKDLLLSSVCKKRPSSIRSPLNSPQPKKRRRSRTGAVKVLADKESSSNSETSYRHVQNTEIPLSLSINDFELQPSEDKALEQFGDIFGKYILLKVACSNQTKILIDFQSFFTMSSKVYNVEKSNIIYYNVLDQKCDDNETVLSIINDLFKKFIATKKQAIIFLEGDQLTYSRIQSLKAEYGSDLSWLVPFPGDWHILKNYQEILVKIYFDAGLLDIAICCGYNTPNSVTNNFKRTHHFIMEAWESLYRLMLGTFSEKEIVPQDFLSSASEMVKDLPPSETQESALRNINQLFEELKEKCDILKLFHKSIKSSASENNNVQFWVEFLFKTCLAYVALYMAIRTSQWDLRMAAIKLMAPVFTAFDRPRYQQLIPQHIRDMCNLSSDVRANLEMGGFTVSLLGRPGHSIGIDEAHEMCINRECKEYVTRPTAETITRTALFLSIKAEAIKNIEKEICIKPKNDTPMPITSIYAASRDNESKKLERNVRKQVTKLQTSSLITSTSNEALSPFQKKNKLLPNKSMMSCTLDP